MKEDEDNERGQIKAGAVIVYVGIGLANFEWFFDFIWTLSSDFTSFTISETEIDENNLSFEESELITEEKIFYEEFPLKQAASTFCMAFFFWNTFMYSVYILSNADITDCKDRTHKWIFCGFAYVWLQ
jgi:hypothetical protein